MPLLVARQVTKTYRTGSIAVDALKGVDLEVGSGELVMIMGPSGNGKTTLLNCLSGLDDIDDGSVMVDGVDIHNLSDAKRTSHRAEWMGFIFQSFNLIPVLTAAENVEVPLSIQGTKPAEARKKATAILDRVGLADRADHRPAELSGGEQQRVAVARALVSEPAIVWADEPTGNLDSETAASVVELLLEINAGGQTLVVVTHDRAIGAMGHRLVQIRDGLVTYDGAPAELPAVPSVVAAPVGGAAAGATAPVQSGASAGAASVQPGGPAGAAMPAQPVAGDQAGSAAGGGIGTGAGGGIGTGAGGGIGTGATA